MKFLQLIFGVSLLFAAPVPAEASECQELWLARNSIFASNGYCFGSDLGKGVFGNSGCRTKNPALSNTETEQIARIKRRENALGCSAQKNRWSVAQMRSVANALNRSTASQRTTPAPQQNCSRRTYITVTDGSITGVASDTLVTGPSHINIYTTNGSATVSSVNSKCVTGTYQYRFVVNYTGVVGTERRQFTGGFRLNPYDTNCTLFANTGQISCR